MSSEKRILYVVENDTIKTSLIAKVKSEKDLQSIIVVTYGVWDFLIPEQIFKKYRFCFIRFFEQCGNWNLGDSYYYHGYVWVRDVPQKTGIELKNFLACLDENYEIQDFPQKPQSPDPPKPEPKSPSPPPRTKRNKKSRTNDLPDWKKRAAGDYD